MDNEQEIKKLMEVADKALIDFEKIIEYLNDNESLDDNSQKHERG